MNNNGAPTAAPGSTTPQTPFVQAPIPNSPEHPAAKAIINSDDPELKKNMENGAIKGNDGMYYMPIGRDSGGCSYYTSFAPGKVTLTTVYYKKPGNGGVYQSAQ